MKITIDENIIYAREAFSALGEITLLHGREFSRENIENSDAIVIRSITPVNEKLLEGTSVKFVGSATIGEDHIDKEYLKARGIEYSFAKGCNAQAVAEYVLSAIAHLTKKYDLSLKDKSIGIIGAGNIGSRVAESADALGLKVIKNDPPLQKSTGGEYSDLKEALQADIVTFHTPMNIGGEYNTFHLLNECNMSLIIPGAILINASRGAVIDNKGLKDYLRKNNEVFTALDVWENEPEIDLELLNLVDIATPHVAGYSYEGKVNGTVMIYEAVCEFFNIEKTWQPPILKADNNIINLESETLERQLYDIFSFIYPITEDDSRIKKLPESKKPGKLFDKLRKEYPFRRELKNYRIYGQLNDRIKRLLKAI